mgnify:FL=1
MNICIGVLLCFAVLGLADKILGGRLGVAAELDRGLAAMGSLSLSMTGIYCLIITAMSALEGGLSAVSRALPFDASLAAGMLLAPDMGGWATASQLAANGALAAYSGLLVASTLGCLVSFTLPIALGSLEHYQIHGFMQGVVWGLIALPAGLVAGALALGLAPLTLAENLWPVLVLCALLVLGLAKAPRVCLGALAAFGEAVRILGVLAFGVVALGLFLPGLALAPESLVAEALIIVFKITVVVCGAMVATALLMARCGSAVSRVAAALGVNEYAVLGLLASLVSTVSMLPLYARMDVRGKVMNAAVSVSGAFVLGGQMAFVSSVSDARSVAAFFVCKLLGGALAAALALRFTRNEQPETTA